MQTEPVLNFVNGKWVAASSGKTLEQRDPADLARVTCRFQRSDRSDAAAAVAAARAAFDGWRALPAAKRAEYFVRLLATMRTRKDEIARTLTEENGKTFREAQIEMESAIKEKVCSA